MPRATLPALALVAALGAPASAQSVDEVIAKSFEGRGGLDRLKAVRTLRMTGRMSVGADDLDVVVEMKRPHKVRVDTKARGRAAVQAYDGKTAWGISPMGNGRAEVLPAEQAKAIADQADLDGPLVDFRAKGHEVELLGKEKVEGKSQWKLKLTRKNGDVDYYFLDARSYLPVRVEGQRKVRGQVIEGEGTVGDYREEGGFLWPHRIENGVKGMPEKQVITFDKVEVNPAIEDARFVMPETKPADAPKD